MSAAWIEKRTPELSLGDDVLGVGVVADLRNVESGMIWVIFSDGSENVFTDDELFLVNVA